MIIKWVLCHSEDPLKYVKCPGDENAILHRQHAERRGNCTQKDVFRKWEKMSEWGYETQSHPVLEVDVPLGVTGINPLLQMGKRSLGEGTCQRRTAEPNPRPWGSAPQAGTHFASHLGLNQLTTKLKGKMFKAFAMKITHGVTYYPSGLSNCLHFLIRTRMCKDTRKNDCPAHPRKSWRASQNSLFFCLSW